MSDLVPKDFDTIVDDSVTAAQGFADLPLDLSEGSPLRAMLESDAFTALWLQGLIFQLLQTTRAATSVGPDLDSWMADFSFYRIPAVGASGQVTFARFTDAAAAVVAVGDRVQTADGTEIFAVIADTTNAQYNPGTMEYTLPIGMASLNILCQAVTAGAASNVPAGTVNTLSQGIAYVDTVTNASAMAGGADAESDAAFRARFALYLSSLQEATEAAIQSAVENTPGVVADTIVEFYDTSGNYRPGYFYVVIDDGSGNPPSPLITAVSNNVDAARALGVAFGVVGPTEEIVVITYDVSVAAGYSSGAVVNALEAATTAYVNSLEIGTVLQAAQIQRTGYAATAGAEAITNVLMNGSSADINPGAKGVCRTSSVTVTPV